MSPAGTSTLAPASARGDDVIGGPYWLESTDRPFTLPIDVPLSAELMVAALYLARTALNHEDELATSEDVRGQIAVTIVTDGMVAMENTCDDIEHGRIDNPSWLAVCRRRVAEVFGAVAR